MLKCGFYEKDITPPLGASIYGYVLPRTAQDVQDKLYAKAAVIENGGETIAIISIDALNMWNGGNEKITERIEKFTGIKPKNVLINVSHSHTSGPVADTAGNPLDSIYIDMMNILVADCAILAYKRTQNMTAKYDMGKVNDVSFARNYIMKDGTIRTNPSFNDPNIVKPHSEIDPDFPILFFSDEGGAPIGAIVNFACHHDSVGNGDVYSGDYSYILAQELKKVYGTEFITIFLNAPCGNINHLDQMNHRIVNYKMIGNRLAEEVVKLEKTAKPLKDATIAARKEKVTIKRREIDPSIVEDALKILETIPVYDDGGMERLDGATMQHFFAAPIKREYYDNKSDTYDVVVQVIRIGELMLSSLPCEVYAQFGKYIKERSPAQWNFVTAMSNNDGSSYIPVPEMHDEPTVYEAVPGSSHYERNAGYILSDKILELGKELMK